MVGDNGHALRGLDHRHRRLPGQEVDQQALVVGVEMLDQDEGHAAFRRHVRKEILEGVEPAGGGAQCHDQVSDPRLLCGARGGS
jgi:hypothetical protein